VVKERDRILNDLENVVGSENVSDDPVIRFAYRDFSSVWPKAVPDYVVRPGSVEEIQVIMRIANREKIPVIPFSAGVSIGGTIAKEGGILLDLRRMNRIIEINRESMYCIVEPGVTYGQLYAELDKKYGDVKLSIPDSSPMCSVLANHTQVGLGEVHSKFEDNPTGVLGIEVVLPTGEVVATGSAAWPGSKWNCRYVLGPDLTGIFLRSMGYFGVITKASIKLYPKPEVSQIYGVGYEDIKFAIKPVRELLQKEIADRIVVRNWGLNLLYKHATVEVPPEIGKGPLPEELLEKWKKETGSPEIQLHITLEGNKEVVDVKERLMKKVISKYNGNAQYLELSETVKRISLEASMGKPSADVVRSILGPRGGYDIAILYTWYDIWPELYNDCKEILRIHGYPPLLSAKTLQHGRASTFRFIFCHFDADNEEECRKIQKVKSELTKLAMEKYKVPSMGLPREVMQQCRNYELLKKIKTALDPNLIMHPSSPLGGE